LNSSRRRGDAENTRRKHRLELLGAFLFITCPVQPQTPTQKSAPTRIELTERDLFASDNWTSTQVSVVGFHLGMSWSDALRTARAEKLQLRAEGTPGLEQACAGQGRCDVFDAEGRPTSISMTFGEKQEINDLSVEKIYTGASPWAEKNQVCLRFKGRTFSLFNQYSKELRLKLLGTDAGTSEDRDHGFTTITYPRYGVNLEISACATKSLEDPCSLLIVHFMQPAR
jgi:hypothetical protein